MSEVIKNDEKEEIIKKINDCLKTPKEPEYLFQREKLLHVEYQYDKSSVDVGQYEMMPKEILELLKNNDIYLPYTLETSDQYKTYSREELSYDECTPEQKNQIIEKQEKIKRIISSNDSKYDKNYRIQLCICVNGNNEMMEFIVTPRQLAIAGIDYEDEYLHAKKVKNLSKEIAEETAKMPYSKVEKAKGFIRGLVERNKGKEKE